jgi:hypothetical protein
MPWEATPYRPPIRNPKGRVAFMPSAPLARLTGTIAYCLVGFAIYKAAQWILGLPPGYLEGKWGLRETVVVGVMLLVGMLGGLIGFAVGIQVSVKNREVMRFAIILWHFFANGQLVGFFLLALILGRNRRTLGLVEAIHVFGMFAAANILAGIALFLARQFKEGAQPQPLVWIIFVVPAAIWTGLQLEKMLQWQLEMAIIYGAVAGLINVFVSARLIQRDYQQMREVNDMVQGQ